MGDETKDRVRRAVMGSLLAACFATGLVGCRTSTSRAPAEANPWIGKTRQEIVRELGEPTRVIPLPETGGKMMIYTEPDQPHYVFEFGPNDRVYRAAETK